MWYIPTVYMATRILISSTRSDKETRAGQFRSLNIYPTCVKYGVKQY